MPSEWTKDSLTQKLKEIRDKQWIPSGRSAHSAGAVGNTLEDMLGIRENNVPLADAGIYEIKTQREQTGSLTTLFHFEPKPRRPGIVADIFLPNYGWAHDSIPNERSFRVTMSGDRFTDRGFRVIVDRPSKIVNIHFDQAQVDRKKHSVWLDDVRKKAGLGEVSPRPYWDFADLNKKLMTKLRNAIYLRADSKIVDGKELFRYSQAELWENPDFDRFLNAIEKGSILVDFDARTHHNHGTKYRIRQDRVPELYATITRIF